MSKMKLFDEDSEEEVSLKTENEYAKKYDAWREKEEMHKLEQKYGTKPLNSDETVTSDSDESDEPPEVNEELEKQFLKTLALLKTKDPRIYDSNYKFFDEKEEKVHEKETKVKTLTFADSDDDDDGGDIFTIEKKAEIQEETKERGKKKQKDEKLKDFLTGKAEHIDDDVEKDLEPLKALWSDPKLSEGEAFLRDYILNKRYLEDGDAGEADDRLRDDEDLEADEKMVEEQGKFERAYNFRFEEPDEEYLKRFPRTMNYIRPKDDRRSRKRAEVRARKDEEKQKKMEEIARLKALKLKEIQEKIARIKEVTGNEELAFEEQDIEGDFDPEEHDRRMRAIFDEEYYGEVDDQKPVFPDLDEELEIENWEKYELDSDKPAQEQGADGPHCEDDDFNMDADYDPKQARLNLLEEIQQTLGKKRRNRKKKSKLGQLLTVEKPKFVPALADKTYDQYMEEYYKMDCEDVIGGDLPTRFKYRDVVPNDFGLTVEEILLADDKELTQWVPLKKIVKYRPENVEKGDVKTYRQRAQDERLKKKMLPSLYKHLPEEPDIVVPLAETIKKKKKKKKNKDKLHENNEHTQEIEDMKSDNPETETNSNLRKEKEKRQKEHSDTAEITEQNNVNTEPVDNSNVPKKKKKKHKKSVEPESVNVDVVDTKKNQNNKEIPNIHTNENNSSKKKKNKYKDGFNVESISNEEPSQQGRAVNSKTIQKDNEEIVQKKLKRKLNSVADLVPNKKKKNNHSKESNIASNSKKVKKFNKNKGKTQKDEASANPFSKLSDERLKAYGLNPKKYKNFLKFKKF